LLPGEKFNRDVDVEVPLKRIKKNLSVAVLRLEDYTRGYDERRLRGADFVMTWVSSHARVRHQYCTFNESFTILLSNIF